MAVKSFSVDIVREPMLVIRCGRFDPFAFKVNQEEKSAPLAHLTLTKPERGPKGGFLIAKLMDGEEVVWTFWGSEELFYNAVKEAIASAKKGTSAAPRRAP